MSTTRAIYGYRKELGLDDDTARDLYQRETGKRHLSEMTPGEQVRVLQAMKSTAQGGSAAAQKGLTGPYAKKLQALWISGFNLGVVRVRTDEALLTFVERQTGLKHTRFLRDAGDASRAIEALKSWLARDAGVEWADFELPMDAVLDAQGRKLGSRSWTSCGTAMPNSPAGRPGAMASST